MAVDPAVIMAEARDVRFALCQNGRSPRAFSRGRFAGHGMSIVKAF
jgi:hypothetical protein